MWARLGIRSAVRQTFLFDYPWAPAPAELILGLSLLF